MGPGSPPARALTLSGHSKAVQALALSRDGATLFSGGDDLTIRAWSTADGGCTCVMSGHQGYLQALAFRDGGFLYSGSADRTIRAWRTGDGACTRLLEGHAGWVQALCLSRDGTTLYSGSSDRTIRMWRVGVPLLWDRSCYAHYPQGFARAVGELLEQARFCLAPRIFRPSPAARARPSPRRSPSAEAPRCLPPPQVNLECSASAQRPEELRPNLVVDPRVVRALAMEAFPPPTQGSDDSESDNDLPAAALPPLRAAPPLPAAASVEKASLAHTGEEK